MKICFLTHRFPALTETYTVQEVIGLIAAGMEVGILAGGRNPQERKIQEDVQRYDLLSKTSYIREGSRRWLRMALWLAVSDPGKLCRILLRSGKDDPPLAERVFLLWFFLRGKYDVLCCQFFTNARRVMFLKDILPIRLVVGFRGSDISSVLRHEGPLAYERVFRKADLLLPVCDHFKKRLLAIGSSPSRTLVQYSGINTERFSFPGRKFDFSRGINILTVCRLVEKKGLEFALSAVCAIAKQSTVPLTYTIIGRGPLEYDLRACISSLGAEKWVRLEPEMTHAEIRLYYEKSDIFVLTSVTAADGNEEGIPNVLKEAMAAGIPVIATRHAGIPELVEDGLTGYLVPERDITALCARISDLVSRPECCAQMGELGSRRVRERFDISILNGRLHSLLASLKEP